MNWLIENKEWIFSGIGVLFLGWLITLVWRFFARRAVQPHSQATIIQVVNNIPSQPPPPHPVEAQSPIQRISSITMKETTESIKNAPPLKHENVARQYDQQPQQLPAEVQSPNTRISSITIQEIDEAIENAPTLQRENVARNYEGIKVRWETQLLAANKDKKDNINLSLSTEYNDAMLLRPVFCSVQLAEYLELGVLPKGTPITVIGRISEVTSIYIKLEECQLFFHHKTREKT